jgi:Rhodopirellula transposase DDE domain
MVLMTPYRFDIEQAMKSFFDSLRENDRRRYAAIEAAKLGHGGTAYVAQLLGIDPKTIREGRREFENLPATPQARVRKKGGGRKRRIEHDPKIEADFQAVLHDHTAGSPTEETLIWTDLTTQEIAARLDERGRTVSVHIVEQLLDKHDYHQRKALRMQRLGDHPEREAQFATIARLKQEYLDAPHPILSMDLKSRELIGNYFRAGTLWTRQTIRTFDHDFPAFAAGVVLPHGLYDLKLNRGYMHLGTSHDTSEFACDCLEDWWVRFGHTLYPRATSLLLLCDGGGSNPADTERSEAHLFKVDLQRLVNRLGREVRVAHYPPYASKYNPIEHRLFPHLTRVCRGVIFHSVDLVASLMKKASTRTGLSVVVDIVDKVYQTGRKVGKAVQNTVRIVRDTVLPRWNYRILPNT